MIIDQDVGVAIDAVSSGARRRALVAEALFLMEDAEGGSGWIATL